MSKPPVFAAAVVGLAFSCSSTGGPTHLGDLGGGKSDFLSIEELPISVPRENGGDPGEIEFTLTSSSDFRVIITQMGQKIMSIAVSGGTVDVETDKAMSVDRRIDADGNQTRYTLTVRNHSKSTLKAFLSLLPADGQADSDFPTLGDSVVMENDFCLYRNTPPYVDDVKWTHPKIVAAMRRLGLGWPGRRFDQPCQQLQLGSL